MPLFGIAQPGPNPVAGLNLADLRPGDLMIMFDGTETPALGLKSVAFSRGQSPDGADNGSTFAISGMPTGMTIDVQVASGFFVSVAAMDKAFTSVQTLGPDANGNAVYTDVGRSAFWRFYISAYSSGAMPIAVVQR